MESASFFNSKNGDRVYNATHWADYFVPLFKTGVFNGDLQVTANGGMSVKVNKGYAWIDGYVYHLTEALTLDMETASGNMDRIDNVVIRLDLTNRWIKCYIVTGNYYQGQATPPAPEVDTTIHELVIARIIVEAGTTAVTQDLIVDTRMDDNLCGWVCGAVDQIKFEQIKAQFDAFFSKYQESIKIEYGNYTNDIMLLEQQAQDRYTSMDRELTEYEKKQKADFEAWVETLKELLNDADAAKLQGEIDEANSRIDQTIKQTDLIPSLAITEPGKVMDGKTCSENLIKALGTTLTATLTAGATSVTFTDPAITDDSLIDVYTDVYGVIPTDMAYDGDTHTLTVTFDPQQAADVGVKVRVM